MCGMVLSLNCTQIKSIYRQLDFGAYRRGQGAGIYRDVVGIDARREPYNALMTPNKRGENHLAKATADDLLRLCHGRELHHDK